MHFERASLETCSEATGLVIVIDVLRAFSTAAYALAAGAENIALVGEVEEALQLRNKIPGALVIGEIGGLPVPGFDFCNSPSELLRHDLRGRRLIQRTTAGTQGVIRSQNAQQIYCASFCCAQATARWVLRQSPEDVTFVITGWGSNGRGDEDAACADYLETLFRGQQIDLAALTQRVSASPAGQMFVDPSQPEFPSADLDLCLQIDRFDFAMPVRRQNNLLLLEKQV